MKKRFRIGFVALGTLLAVMGAVLLTGIIDTRGKPQVKAAWNDTDGYVGSEYIISTYAELNDATVRTRMGQTRTNGYHFKLGANIDLGGNTNWISIPSLAAGNSFDGGSETGKSINNLTIDNVPTKSTNNGLFRQVSGTVKNLVMTNVDIIGGVQDNVAAVAGTVAGTAARFENIQVSDGKIRGRDRVGGIVGTVESGQNCDIIKCFNGADVEGTSNSGGILGRKNLNGTVNIEYSANEGNISTSAASGYAGGIVGNIEGQTPTVNINWCYNRGDVQGNSGNYVGGIVGRVRYGTVKIENCFNDAAISTSPASKAAIVCRENTNATVTVTNSYFNKDITNVALHYQSSNTTNFTVNGGSEGKTSNYIRSQAFVDYMNSGQTPPIYVRSDINNVFSVKLRAFETRKIFMFTDYSGEITTYLYKENGPEYDTALTFPTPPHQTGYDFDGWQEQSWETTGWTDVVDIYNPYDGMTDFDTENKKYVLFKAIIGDETKFDIVLNSPLDTSGLTQYVKKGANTSLTGTFFLGETDISLYASGWTGGNTDYNWVVLMKGKDGLSPLDWDPLGTDLQQDQELPLDDIISVRFINNYVDNGKITVRINKRSDANKLYIEEASNLQQAGSVEYTIGGAKKSINLAGYIGYESVPKSGWITHINAIENPHYKFVKYELFDSGGNPMDDALGSNEITDKDYDALTENDARFDLAGGLAKIVIHYEKVQYNFEFVAKSGTTVLEGLTYENLISQKNSLPITIDNIANVTAVAVAKYESDDKQYRFDRWRLYDWTNKRYVDETKGVLKLDKEYLVDAIDTGWLARYIKEGENTVIFIAEYVEIYHISVFIPEQYQEWGDLTIRVYDSLGYSYTERSLDTYLPKGSLVEVSAVANDYYQFNGFENTLEKDFPDPDIGWKIIIMVEDAPREIWANFKQHGYIIRYDARDSTSSIGNRLWNINIPSGGTIRINDVLQPTAKVEVPNYRFVQYEIYEKDNKGNILDTIILDGTNEINEQLLKSNVEGNHFIIVARYIRIYTLNIIVPENASDGGTYEVYYADQPDKPTDDRWFEPGEDIIIRVSLSNENFYRFDGFLVMPDDGVQENQQGDDTNTLRIKMTNSLTVTIRFSLKPIDITETLTVKGNGELGIGKTTGLRVDGTVTLVAIPGNMQEVKKWVVNGIDITKELPDNMKREGDNLIITLTSTWLGVHGAEINSTVEYGLSTQVLIIIICAAGAVILLGAGIGLFYANLARTNKKIRAQLGAENRVAATLGAANFFADMKEGKNVGMVTKADIKHAKKEKKKAKKEGQ